ncbi:hypothetical protein [Bacillus sp. M6-12]|nr:hypothetical protein [Bacillus sp. M6-12]
MTNQKQVNLENDTNRNDIHSSFSQDLEPLTNPELEEDRKNTNRNNQNK